MNSQIFSFFSQCFPLSRLFEKPLSNSVTLTDTMSSVVFHQGEKYENLNKLTRLDLTWCKSLSDLGQIPFSIRELHVKHSGIRQLPSRIGHLTHLTELSVESCTSLQSLPSSICNITSLKFLNVSSCRVLNKLPENFGNLESLEKLDASCSGLLELPLSIRNLKRLTRLDVRGCISLSHLSEIPCSIEELELRGSGLRLLPSTIGLLSLFKELWLDSCESLESLPSSLCNLESLEELDVSFSGLRDLPLSINNLKKLVLLSLIGCEYLESLPDLPSNLKVLDARNCRSLQSVSTFSFSIYLDLSSCPKLKASVIMEKYLQEALCRSSKMSYLCISGSEVPEWMTYSNNSGSFVIELATKDQSISFIFCVVVSSNATHYHNQYSPVAILATEVGEIYFGFGETYCSIGETYCSFSSYERVGETIKETFKVFLWSSFHVPCKYVKGVSFGHRLPETYGKIMFGVHPIFENENYRSHIKRK